jgi:hypothetical protein
VKALAHSLAARCHELEQQGLDAATAEGVAFEELGHEGGADLYQEFLSAYAPERRRDHGVYYTPKEVVGVQVRLAADVLERRLGAAFGDEQVLLLDPAVGSGAYPLAVREHLGPGVSQRMRLFEPMVGAAWIARAHGLPVEERDALAEPVVLDAPVVVCLGNPPYRRARSSSVRRTLVAGLRQPDGVHAKNLYNEYVYFWRWALASVFEQRTGAGIVSFVTAASYLRGPAFGGLRRLLRSLLDELWIFDLEGDHLAARRSDNVFAIRTPVAIAMGVRYAERRPAEPAKVHYARLEGNRREKLAALDRITRLEDQSWQQASHGWQAPLQPLLGSAYASWPKLTEIFPWQLSGAQFKRTWPIGPTPEVLHQRWACLLESPERATAFRETRDRDLTSMPPDLIDLAVRLTALGELKPGQPCIEPRRYAYRSFDRQWVIPDARLGDFPRPMLWRVVGPRQIFLTSLLTNVLGPGPAAVATALVPDLDHFRGSFGARAVIPLWCDAAATRPNVAPGLLDELGVTAEVLMAYCYALLGTRSYVARFEDELRTPGPRIPVTADAALFERTAALGERLLAIHTYREVPAGKAQIISSLGDEYPARFAYDPNELSLHLANGTIGPVAHEVWAYRVSGFCPIQSWLRRRITPSTGKSPLDTVTPRTWTTAMTQELLELVWVLEATLALEPGLDAVLDEIVSGGSAAQPRVRWLSEQPGDAFGPQRPREDVALPLIAAELREQCPL